MSRKRRALVAVVVLGVAAVPLRTRLLELLTFYPDPVVEGSPADAGLTFRDLSFTTADGLRLHGWWVPALESPSLGSVLYCHGNAGNVGTRVAKAKLLASRGLDVLLFDYRGYGRSEGRPTEEGSYLDARAAREELLRVPGVDPGRILYLGESLGGAVATELACAAPPRGLVLQSTFTTLRDMATVHYPVVPRFLVPDAYPTLRRIGDVRCPVLLVHGDLDEVVPLSQGRALLDAAREPRRLEVIPGAGHNDILAVAAERYGELLAGFARSLS